MMNTYIQNEVHENIIDPKNIDNDSSNLTIEKRPNRACEQTHRIQRKKYCCEDQSVSKFGGTRFHLRKQHVNKRSVHPHIVYRQGDISGPKSVLSNTTVTAGSKVWHVKGNNTNNIYHPIQHWHNCKYIYSPICICIKQRCFFRCIHHKLEPQKKCHSKCHRSYSVQYE